MELALLAGRVGAAGLGLGAFSTTMNVIQAIHFTMSAWEQFTNVDRDVDYFKARLLLQRSMLDSWKSDWYGFRHTGQVTMEKLQLLSRHDMAIKSTLKSVQQELQLMNPDIVLQAVRSTLTVSSRFTWVASGHKDSEETLSRVETLLRGLYMLLPPQSSHVRAQMLMGFYERQVVSGSGIPEQSLPFVKQIVGLRELNEELEDELKHRIENWQHSAQTVTSTTTIQPDRLQLEAGTAGTRSHGEVDGKSVLIEWKEYASLQGDQGVDLRGRRENLVRLLKATPKPDEMLALPCMGYFDNIAESQYGFVFESPAGPGEKLVSLNTFFRDTPAESLPSLQDRYMIAYRLALSLSILFVIEWLHKGLRSHNILFVQTDRQPRWSQPYLCGFAFSRPDKLCETSEKLDHSERFNLYRHPKTQNAPRPGYTKAFDIYSFGVILFEIAGWSPAFKLWEQDAVKFRKTITKPSNLARVAHAMGSDYQDVMMKCLDGTFEQDHTTVSRMFFMEVVEVLRRLVG